MKTNGFTIVELMIAMAIIGILVAFAIPAYDLYVARAKISEGHQFAAKYILASSDYYQNHGAFPNSLNQIGETTQDTAPSRYVTMVCLQNSGAFQVGFGGDPVSGALQYVPEIASGGSVRWYCYGIEIPTKYLPQQCRNTDIIYNNGGLLIIRRQISGESQNLAYAYPCPEYNITSTASRITNSSIDYVQNMYVYMRDKFSYTNDQIALVYNSYTKYLQNMQESWYVTNTTGNPYQTLQCGNGYSPSYTYGLMVEVGDVSASGVCPASNPVIWNCQKMITKNGVRVFEIDPNSRWTCGPKTEEGLIY